MFKIENLDNQQKEAIEKLRIRFKDTLPPNMYEDSQLFYRFLKARDFNLNKAECMLNQHIVWRRAMQVDTILEDFEPSPIFVEYMQPTYLGKDMEGYGVGYGPLGDYHIRDVLGCFKLNNFLKQWIWKLEKELLHLDEANKKAGRNVKKITLIVNLDKLQLNNTVHPSSALYIIRVASFFQDNYPETLNAAYVINAPAYYVIAYAIIKRFLAAEVIHKIRVYGKTGWKEDILKVIDPDVLPAFLGGNRTDPDGNPMCNTIVCHGGRIPLKYYLSREERTFKDMTQVKHVSILPGTCHEVLVEVQECGSVIQWEYEVKSKNIGFGLYFGESEEERKEILPIYRYETPDGTDVGSYKCQLTGTYVIIFDNSFSWIHTKEVSYHITVSKLRR